MISQVWVWGSNLGNSWITGEVGVVGAVVVLESLLKKTIPIIEATVQRQRHMIATRTAITIIGLELNFAAVLFVVNRTSFQVENRMRGA